MNAVDANSQVLRAIADLSVKAIGYHLEILSSYLQQMKAQKDQISTNGMDELAMKLSAIYAGTVQFQMEVVIPEAERLKQKADLLDRLSSVGNAGANGTPASGANAKTPEAIPIAVYMKMVLDANEAGFQTVYGAVLQKTMGLFVNVLNRVGELIVGCSFPENPFDPLVSYSRPLWEYLDGKHAPNHPEEKIDFFAHTDDDPLHTLVIDPENDPFYNFLNDKSKGGSAP